jgi:hypothetical protein
MVAKMALVVCFISLVLVSPVLPAYTKPHIIMVVADDLVRIFIRKYRGEGTRCSSMG